MTKAYPTLPETRAVAYVALTTLILAYSSLFNVVPILIFLGLWLAHTIYQGQLILRPAPDMALVLVLPLLAVASFFWSDYPGKTIYLAAEFVAMAFCVIIVARLCSPLAVLKGLALGGTLVLAITLASGNYARDYFSDERALVGWFGSKNQVGFFGQITLIAGLMIAFARALTARVRLFYAAPALLVGALCLGLSQSASSLLSLFAVFSVLAVMVVITRAPMAGRVFFLGFAAFGAVVAALCLLAFSVDLQTMILESLGKNPTLTGRTYLWAEGTAIGLEKPLLGHGYAGFWVAGQPQAEQYWREFFITNQSGFHFHNLFIQAFVDLGALGLVTVTLLLLYALIRNLARVVRHGMDIIYVFPLALAVMFAVRAVVEVDWLGPFGIGPLLMFYAVLKIRPGKSGS